MVKAVRFVMEKRLGRTGVSTTDALDKLDYAMNDLDVALVEAGRTDWT